jgi:hypothetical protein
MTQDFNMTNRAASHVDDAVEFMDFAQAALSPVSLALWAAQHPIQAARLAKQAHAVDSLAAENFWSGSPYLFGTRAAKFLVRPCAGTERATLPEGASHDDPRYLRADLDERLAGGICFDFFVQLRNHPAQQPIEVGSAVWDEQLEVPIPVARLTASRPADPTRAVAMEQFCNDLSFNPWHGRTEQQPLGHMNRARKLVYLVSANHRARGFTPEPSANGFSGQ